MEKYKVDRQNAVKNGVLFLIAEDIVAFLRLYEESLLNNKTLCDDVTSTNCSTTHIRRNPKFYLELHGQDIFLHAFNRRCLQIEYGDSDMPKEISGKVTAVGRFTMDLTMRDVVRQLSHLPLGHIFYFVVLDFHGSVVGESTRSRMEYGWTLSKLSKRQVNVLEAVGYDVNDKLSLDLKRTDVYLADEFFSLPDAELQAFRRGISTQVPLLQRPVRWCIIELPSGSQAFFTEEMIQERLLEELQEHTQQKQTQSGHCQLNALQQQLLEDECTYTKQCNVCGYTVGKVMRIVGIGLLS
ncbi:hypothetical protein ECG_01980 [Echinococcus granulosus]|nr:hypothetical protein ECG_01980 [Echinococcus granulosus]